MENNPIDEKIYSISDEFLLEPEDDTTDPEKLKENDLDSAFKLANQLEGTDEH